MALRPRISERDLGMLRYWIANIIQLQNGQSAIDVKLINQDDLAVVDKEIILVGNYNLPGQQEIKEPFTLKTDKAGHARLNFEDASVISKLWYVGLKGDNIKDFEKIAISQSTVSEITFKR